LEPWNFGTVNINYCKINPQKNKQVKPGVDDAGFEIEERQYGTGINQHPDQSHFLVEELFADAVKDNQRYNTTDGVREARGEFVDAKNLHGDHLHPDEQGRLFPERLIVDLNVKVIFCNDHLPCDLGEVHLVPVEKGHVSQERKEEDGCAEGDGEVNKEIISFFGDQNN